MASRVYSYTLLPLDPPSRLVRSMGNVARKAWQVRAARSEHLQATSCWGVLRPRLPRMVELQCTAIFRYSLVRLFLSMRHTPLVLTASRSFQDVQKLSPMETSMRFIPESLSGMLTNTVAGFLVEYVSGELLGGFGVVATVVRAVPPCPAVCCSRPCRPPLGLGRDLRDDRPRGVLLAQRVLRRGPHARSRHDLHRRQPVHDLLHGREEPSARRRAVLHRHPRTSLSTHLHA